MADQRLRFVRYLVGWLVAVVLVLAVLDAFSLELFYVLALIGYVIVYELTAVAGLDLRWRRRVRVVGVLFVLGFAAIAGWQVLDIVRSVA